MERATVDNPRSKGTQPDVITDDRPMKMSHDDEKPSATMAEQAADLTANLEAKYALLNPHYVLSSNSKPESRTLLRESPRPN
jgi:hypothetical protein